MKKETIITIGKGIVCEHVPAPFLEKIKKDLSFDNPEYINAVKYGKFISADTPSHLHLFEIEKDNCWLPRGYVYWLLKWMHSRKHPHRIRDKTLLLKPLNLKFKGELKELQKPIIPDLMGYPCGVLEAEAGSGKTVVGIYMIVQRGQPALVIVHSKELLYQWEARVMQFTGEEAGLVGDGKFKLRPITIGIINSIKNKIDELEPHFGHLICDEAHRITSESWAGAMQKFRARYWLGLTATPFRPDGLGNAIFASIGPLRHTVDRKKLQDEGDVLKPTISRIRTSFNYMFLNDYSTMITELTKDIDRNTLITNKIAQDLKENNENILIVSDRQKHLKIMQKTLFRNHGIKSHVLSGGVGTKQRKKIIQRVKDGLCKVLFATTSLIGEGFDAPELAAMLMGTPIKFSGRLIQTVGRILRPKEGKFPRLYDFRDDNIPVLQYSGFNRDRVYKKKGW